MPEGITGWGWEQDRLDELLYNSFYKPIEAGLEELFADEFYKEAILEQVKGFAVTPGGAVADYEVGAGKVTIQHTLHVNQGGNFCGPFFNTFVKNFKDALENGLS